MVRGRRRRRKKEEEVERRSRVASSAFFENFDEKKRLSLSRSLARSIPVSNQQSLTMMYEISALASTAPRREAATKRTGGDESRDAAER